MVALVRTWTALMSTVAAVGFSWTAWTVSTRSPPPAQPQLAAACPPCVQDSAATPEVPAQPVDSDAFPAHPELGQSEGLPADGHLHRASQLPEGPDRVVRNPNTAFGTTDTVRHLDAALSRLRRDHPRIHRVLVGDLSSEVGGRLFGHVSHQTGRDVDVGFVYQAVPDGVSPGLRVFQDATRENLNLKATFALLRELSASHGEPGGMQWGLLDYEVQRILVHWARRSEAASAQELGRMFQYPKGAYAPVGLYRHYANHRNHVHVRYACPKLDAYCESPAGPPVHPRKKASAPKPQPLQ